MKYEIKGHEQSFDVEFELESERLLIKTVGMELRLEAAKVQPGVYSVLLNNRSYVVGVNGRSSVGINVNGTPVKLELLDAVHLHLRELGWDAMEETKAGEVNAQIPGLITKIFHDVGDQVAEGEPIFLIEAMKMENEIKAPISGTIEKIGVQAGQTVEKGTNILRIV